MEDFIDFPTQNLNEQFEKIALQDNLLTAPPNSDRQNKDTFKIKDRKLPLIIKRKISDDTPLKQSCTETTSSSEDILPPKTIFLKHGNQREPKVGYVQLCYDHQQETIIPMMEVSFDGRNKRGKIPFALMTPDDLPTLSQLSRAASSPTKSLGTVISSLTIPDSLINTDEEEVNFDSGFDPVILGEELNMYLLHDEDSESGYNDTAEVAVGCSDAIQKLVFRSVLRLKRKRRKPGVSHNSRERKRFSYQPMKA